MAQYYIHPIHRDVSVLGEKVESNLKDMTHKPGGYYSAVRKEMLDYIPEHARMILEFGCGVGGFSALVKEKRGTENWAVEIDKQAAAEAAKKLDKVINENALRSLNKIPDNYFDCIILFDVLEHLPDPYSLLRSLKAKLVEKGVVVASLPNIRYYRTFIDFVIHGSWDYKDHGVLDKTHLRFFTHKSIVKIFNQLGFEILKLEGIHPTSSRTFKVLNMILLNSLSDVRYKHFAVVIRPKLHEV